MRSRLKWYHLNERNKMKREVYVKCGSCLTARMNFFKRATTSIVRRPGKTIILLLLVFILGTVIAGAISVNGAISNTDASLRARMPAIATTYFDHDSFSDTINWDNVDWEAGEDPWREAWEAREVLTADHVRAIEALDYVAYAEYIIRSWMDTFDLERYTVAGEIEAEIDMWGPPEGLASFALFGSSSTELVHVQNNIINLAQGHSFDASHLTMGADPNRSVAIISESLANTNNLSIGSTIVIPRIIPLPLPPGEWLENWGDSFLEENLYTTIELEVEIIGLFDVPNRITNPAEGEEEEQQRQVDRLNNIYVPNWALEELDRQEHEATLAAWESVDFDFDPMYHWMPMGGEDQETEVTPVFTLTDPELFDAFRSATEDLLPEHYNLVDMLASFENVASSMNTMRNIAFWVLWISVGATLLILSLLITLFLRDRRYEMGVYLALGEKKGKIISQILMEVVVTALIGITLAVFAGHFISSGVSQGMLESQLLSQQSNQSNSSDHQWDPESAAFENIGMPRTEMTPEEMMEAFEISFSIETIGLFYGIGLGAVVLSTVAPVIYVVTLKPKKVLM